MQKKKKKQKKKQEHTACKKRFILLTIGHNWKMLLCTYLYPASVHISHLISKIYKISSPTQNIVIKSNFTKPTLIHFPLWNSITSLPLLLNWHADLKFNENLIKNMFGGNQRGRRREWPMWVFWFWCWIWCWCRSSFLKLSFAQSSVVYVDIAIPGAWWYICPQNGKF